MKKLLVGIALATVALGGVAQANETVNVRQVNQDRRIDAGVRSGKLTHAEAARLRAQQKDISRYTAYLRAKHGGKLTEHDKRLIHARQDAANAAILKKKGNAVRGPNQMKI